MANLVISDEIREALADIRNDKTETNFTVVSYEPDVKPHTLKLLATGSDGVDGLRAGLDSSDACYALLRVDFQFEKVGNVTSSGTRFIYIFLRPETLPLKRKMMLGSVEGKVKKLFGPVMKNLEIDSPDKLTAESIQDMIDEITMTKDKTTTKKAEKGIFVGGRFHKEKSAKTETTKAKMRHDSFAKLGFASSQGASVTFDDEDKLTEAIAKVRSDKDDTTFCIFCYKDKQTIEFHSEGSDENSVDALMQALPGDRISYALFRLLENYSSGRNDKGQKTVKIDAVRFGFIVFVPEEGNLPPTLKAVVSTHKGAVVKKFRPFSHQWFLTRREELSTEEALEVFTKISGTKSNVTDRKVEKKEVKYERKFIGGATGDVQKLQFQDKDALTEAIAAVRSDSDETVFALAAFDGDRKNLSLKLETTGTNIDNLVGALRDDALMYALVRLTSAVDDYDTTKFLLIKFEGPGLSITYKGAAGVFHGAVTETFGPVHTNAACASADEVAAKLSL